MRARRLLGGLSAAILLAVLLIGVPLLLVDGLGNPLPDWSALKSGEITDQVVLQLLGCVLWIAWAQWVPGTLLEIATGVSDARTQRSPHSHRPPRQPRHISAGQGLSRALVTAVIGLAIAAPIAAGTARAWAKPTAAGPRTAPAAPTAMVEARKSDTAQSSDATELARNGDSGRAPATPTGTRRSADAASAKRHPIFVVGSDPAIGPSMWSIAQHTMGNPLRWREIWALNKDHRMSDGVVFTNPDLIHDGWRLELPADASLPGRSSVVAGSQITVRPGDTVDAIARDQLHIDPRRLIDANLGRSEPGDRVFDDPNLVLPGWKLRVPASVPDHVRPATPNHRPAAPGHPKSDGRDTAPTSPTVPPADPSTSAAPTREAEPTQHTQSRSAAADRSAIELPMVAFVGGGVLLAGASLSALVAYRRRQFRLRRPGNTINSTPPGLLRAERTLLSVGAPAVLDVAWLDQVLRGLVHAMAGDGDPASLADRLPDVLAVRLARDELELVLASARPNAPAPWRVNETGRRWTLSRGEQYDYNPARRAYDLAPFPMLASIGYDADDGSQWLLDLERVASLSIAGDAERCLDLARFLACELAHNTWSEMLQVTLVRFGRELVAANPDRLSYTADCDAAIAEIDEQIDVVSKSGIGVLPARVGMRGDDAWAPRVLLIAPGAARDRDGLDRLVATLGACQSRMAVAVVRVDNPVREDATAWTMTVDADGILHIPGLGLRLHAQQMPAEEAAEIAQLLALSATSADVPMPSSSGEHPWERFADAAGALRLTEAEGASDGLSEVQTTRQDMLGTDASPVTDECDHAVADLPRSVAPSRAADSSESMNRSALPLPRETYLERAATTAEDIAALAPHTSDEICEKVESAVGDLDADLAEWYDEKTVRPRVSLLGPVLVRAQGDLPQRNPRLEWHTEVVAYLATRPSGVSSEQYGTALWPNDPEVVGKSKVRQSVMIVRKWLGKNPATGLDYLPSAMAPGFASYRIEGALIDAELFRRLRLRGLARGSDGIEDLWSALRLVTGEPFSERRKEGYAWLADNPLHHIYSAMIVDVAHTLATHHLGAGEPARAAEAAQIALDAGSTEDVPLLDKVAACDAQELRSEAEAFIKRILTNHDAEIEEDLPPRTAEVLMRRQWMGNAG
jgi:hypothetical protein